jgi:Protein phosphatase 2C
LTLLWFQQLFFGLEGFMTTARTLSSLGTWCGCASVTGRAHRLMGRVSQDACVTLQHAGVTVAAVADGCSSGAHSELGAGVGARVAAAAAARRAASGTALSELPALVLADWTEELTRLARLCAPDPADAELFAAVVNDAWLATLLVAVSRGDRAIVFGVGDGVVSVNGRVTQLEQGDAPDYPAYALFPEMTQPRLVVHHDGPFFEIVIATDGARGFEQDLLHAAREPRLKLNPSLLQKKLNMLRDAARAPDDDCTLAVLTHEVTSCA